MLGVGYARRDSCHPLRPSVVPYRGWIEMTISDGRSTCPRRSLACSTPRSNTSTRTTRHVRARHLSGSAATYSHRGALLKSARPHSGRPRLASPSVVATVPIGALLGSGGRVGGIEGLMGRMELRLAGGTALTSPVIVVGHRGMGVRRQGEGRLRRRFGRQVPARHQRSPARDGCAYPPPRCQDRV